MAKRYPASGRSRRRRAAPCADRTSPRELRPPGAEPSHVRLHGTAARRRGERDAGVIERSLRAVFEAHGEDPPPGLATAARMAAAANARRGTRRARLLWMGARGAGDTVRWAWQRPPGDPAAADRAQARRVYRAVGGMATAAVVLTAAAVRAPGWWRLPWGAGAAVTWLTAGNSGTVGTALTQLSRSAGPQPPSPGTGRRPVEP